ncbi:MAG TPA: AraC family transcriptional regulator [Mucilaginibacter sp.]|nr:AraC family transcriptional regulator [Mucilaginibacter sp.]
MPTQEYPRIYLYRRIVQAKLFIDSHYADAINLDSIAGSAWFSKFHFIRLFKTIYGKTPHQYLTHVRINKAMLLLESGASVSEVCYSVGFDSITSFTGLFKRVVKQTPSGYQQLQLARKADMGKTPLKYVPNCFAEAKGWV